MSSGGHESQSFFAPLAGRSATFLVPDRQTNLEFARAVVGLLPQTGDTCAIIDLDAFYSSNSDRIFSQLSPSAAQGMIIRVPEPGADIEFEFSTLFGVQQRVVIIDSLNSFYHLVSLEDGSSRGKKLAFAVASLSYFARTNHKVVILTMYRREGFARGGAGRSISGLSDITASADVRGQQLDFRSERGSAWPGGRLSIRIPSG